MNIYLNSDDLKGKNILAKLPDKEVDVGPFTHTYVPKARLEEREAELAAARDWKKTVCGELLALISGAGIATPAEGYAEASWCLLGDIRKIVEELKTARARLARIDAPSAEPYRDAVEYPRLHPNSDALDDADC